MVKPSKAPMPSVWSAADLDFVLRNVLDWRKKGGRNSNQAFVIALKRVETLKKVPKRRGVRRQGTDRPPEGSGSYS